MIKHCLPERMRLLRLAKGMTQETIARAILVPRVTYTHYELGKRTPDLDMLLRIADFHKVSVDFLLGATWLRPSLEQWLAEKADQELPGSSYQYPSAAEHPGDKIADSPEEK